MTRRVFPFTAISFLACASPAWAASDFPRGPGFYFNLFTFASVLIVYFFWIYIVGWVDGDAKKIGLDRKLWSGVVFGVGILGFLLFWLVPPFLISFVLLLACVFGPYGYYVSVRNPLVVKGKRLWTERHFKKILKRFLKIKYDIEPDELPPPAGPEIKYLRRPNETESDEPARIRKAKQHRGAAEAATLLVDAIERRAADWAMEPSAREWAVKLWIDGIAHAGTAAPRAEGEAAIQALKLLAELDLAEKRKPQEGQFPVEVDGVRYECRLHTAGTVAGEKLAMRISERSFKFRRLPELGLHEAAETQLSAALRNEQGLIVVAGAHGAGVTATAHSLLLTCDKFQKSIIGIEDPVETRLPNVDQFPLDRRAGENFAAAVRRIITRHEPNILFVGELRDKETAELVLQKSGEHLLFITAVEAADAIAGLFKLTELGLSGPKLAKSLLGVLSPRLVRVLCPDCKVKYKPNPEMVRKANLPVDRVKFLCRPPEKSEQPRDEEGRILTCEKCRGVGYYGRTGIFEYLTVTDRLRQLLKENAAPSAVKQEAVRGGMSFIQDEAMRLAVDGITSIAEILRVLS